MGKYRLAGFLYAALVIASMHAILASGMSVQELAESYDYNFSDGTINLTSFDDYMSDGSGNAINDTLVINLTTNVSASTTYLFIVTLEDGANIVKNYSNKTVSSSDRSAQVKFDTALLSRNRFNYSVDVRKQDFALIYSADKLQTDYYSAYESGVSITSVTDFSLNNNLLVISLGLNVTKNQTVNVTAYLNYGNKSLSATTQVSLTTPDQSVNVSFDNETVKRTHYSGVFSLESIKVGDKTLETAYNTSAYNYADFAKTSYIKAITSRAFDNTSNNLSDALQFNFTVNVTSAATYTLEVPLYDFSDNLVKTLAKNETLGAGMHSILLEVLGKDVYSTYYNGKFKLSVAKLSIGNLTQDIIYDAHITNTTFYSDFERPKLPDLTLSMSLNFFGTNSTNVTVNVTNSGEAPVFNIVLDVFDDNTFQNQSSTDYLAANESQIFNFLAPNTTTTSIFVSVVDFDNLVDESNESNNLVDTYESIVSLEIQALSEIRSAGTSKLFEVIIENNGNTQVNNVTWKIDTGDGTVINSTFNVSLAANEITFVYVEYNYTSEGDYTVTANATAVVDGVTATSSLGVTASTSTLSLSDLSSIYSNSSEKLFEFVVTNNASSNVSVNWTVNFGDGNVVNSSENVNLNVSEQLFVYARHVYENQGVYTVTASAQDSSNLDFASISIEVAYLNVTNLSVINVSGTRRTFEFVVDNLMADALSDVGWSFDTGNGVLFNSTSNVTLASGEGFFVFIDYDYGTSGSFTVNASVRNDSIADYEVLDVDT